MQTKQNISLHINNCFKEKELEKFSTVKDSLTVQKEGHRIIKRKIVSESAYYGLLKDLGVDISKLDDVQPDDGDI